MGVPVPGLADPHRRGRHRLGLRRNGAPLTGVCIAIGPNGCQEHSPRTDARGVYYADFPAASVEYDLHFDLDGFKEFSQRIRPTQNQVLNIVLAR